MVPWFWKPHPNLKSQKNPVEHLMTCKKINLLIFLVEILHCQLIIRSLKGVARTELIQLNHVGVTSTWPYLTSADFSLPLFCGVCVCVFSWSIPVDTCEQTMSTTSQWESSYSLWLWHHCQAFMELILPLCVAAADYKVHICKPNDCIDKTYELTSRKAFYFSGSYITGWWHWSFLDPLWMNQTTYG